MSVMTAVLQQVHHANTAGLHRNTPFDSDQHPVNGFSVYDSSGFVSRCGSFHTFIQEKHSSL